MPAPYVEDALFFFPLYFSFFVKSEVFKGVWIHIQVFDLIPLINLSILMPIASCFHCWSSIIKLDIRDGDASKILFLYCTGSFWLFCFCLFVLFSHMKLIIVLWRSVRNCIVIFMGIALNLKIALSGYCKAKDIEPIVHDPREAK